MELSIGNKLEEALVEGHPEGEGFDFIERNAGVIADAAFSGASSVIVCLS